MQEEDEGKTDFFHFCLLPQKKAPIFGALMRI